MESKEKRPMSMTKGTQNGEIFSESKDDCASFEKDSEVFSLFSPSGKREKTQRDGLGIRFSAKKRMDERQQKMSKKRAAAPGGGSSERSKESAETQWDRTRLLFGEEGLEKLRSSFVLVAGCGAVGSFAIEALARAGVERLALVDFDTVSLSNINRQIFALHSTLGWPKTQVALERVRDISPSCRVEVFNVFINEETVGDILNEAPDFAIDAIDNLSSKALLIEELQKRKIPFISSMGAARKTEPFLIRMDKMKKTSVCPLAGKLRKILRQKGVSLDFPCVYSLEEAKNPQENRLLFPEKRQEETPEKEIQRGEERSLNETLSKSCIRAGEKAFGEEKKTEVRPEKTALGSLPTVTGIFGLILANEAIKYLLQSGKTTS